MMKIQTTSAGTDKSWYASFGLAGAAFAFAVVLIFWRLGELPLIDPDEGRNASVALEMSEAGSWLVPRYNGLPYLDKPAFYFRMVAGSFDLFGVSETAARLPSALAALLLLVVVYRFARAEYGERVGALSVVAVVSMPLFLTFARMVIFDMTLALFVCAAIVAGYRAEERSGTDRRRLYAWSALFAGLATLVKGPVGFIVPGLVLLAFAVVERNHGVARRLARPRNLLVFAATVLPWFIAVSVQRPDFPYYALMKESLERFTAPTFDRSAPFYYYGPVLLGACFAWALLIPAGAKAAWKDRRRLGRPDRLLITWCVVVVAFFSISQSKLPGYVLSAVVALGILVARLFDRALEPASEGAKGAVFRGTVMVAGIGALASGWLLLEVFDPGLLSDLFRIDDAAYERSRATFPALLATTLVIATISIAGTVTRRAGIMLAAFLVFPVALLTICFPGLRSYAESSSSRALAAALDVAGPGAAAACLQCFPTGLVFYHGSPVHLITADGHETTSNYVPFFLEGEEHWPPQLVRVEKRDEWLDSRRDAVVLLSPPAGRSLLSAIGAARGAEVVELLPGQWWGLVLPGDD